MMALIIAPVPIEGGWCVGCGAIRDAWWKVALSAETAGAVAERIFLRRLEILPKAELRLFSSWIYVVAIERR
jgi:hypothetical protein